MIRHLRHLAPAAGLAVTAGIVLGPSAAGAVATAPSCGTGTLVTSPNVGKVDLLHGIAAAGPRDVWVVGSRISQLSNPAGAADRPLAEHWDGMRWQVAGVPRPAAVKVDLNAVAAVSATDVWAVGGTANRHDERQRTLIEHWNGSAWRIVPSPADGILQGVAAGAAGNVWAVGFAHSAGNGPGRTLTEHWDGTRWRVVPSPSPGRFPGFAGVSVTGPDSVWAVGGVLRHGNEATLAEHWNGRTWSPVPVPAPGMLSQLQAVTSAGSGDVWAVGTYYAKRHQLIAQRTLTERWNGTRWSVVRSPRPREGGQLAGVAAVSANDVWAVGTAGRRDLVARWNGRAWAVVAAPQRQRSVDTLAAVSARGAADVWAAGTSAGLPSQRRYRTLVEDVCPG